MNCRTAIRRKRRVFVVIIVTVVAILSFFGIRRAVAVYQDRQSRLPVLCVEDSHGKVIEIYEPWRTLTVDGPARAWSPRYGIAVWEEKWDYPKFQLADHSVGLRMQGGNYLIFLQPAGYGEVNRDLKKSKGEIIIRTR